MKNLMLLPMSLVLVAMCAGVGFAADNECETDADCPNGFACVEAEAEAAVGATLVDMSSDGSTDSDSEDEGGEDEAAPVEEPPAETYMVCDAKPCDADADCDGGTVCVVIELEECDSWAVGGTSTSTPSSGSSGEGSGSSDDFAADPVDPEEEEKEESSGKGEGEGEPTSGEDCETIALPGFCGPKWLAPCEVATDCGDSNFACVEAESCRSTGSSGSGTFTSDPDSSSDSEEGSDSGADPIEPVDDEGDEEGKGEGFAEGEENCEGTGYFYCEMEEIACTDSADCPADWDCLENPSAGAGVSISMDVPCDVDEDGNEDCPEEVQEVPEPTTDISSLCFPPGYEDYVGWGGPGGGSEMSADATNTGTAGGGDPQDDGSEQEEAPPSSSSSSSDDGGCAGGPQPLSAAWMALALLALALRRREQLQA